MNEHSQRFLEHLLKVRCVIDDKIDDLNNGKNVLEQQMRGLVLSDHENRICGILIVNPKTASAVYELMKNKEL